MAKAKLIKADGTEHEIKPESGNEFTLKELQQYVDGHIEITNTKDNRFLVLDEEGKLKRKPVNIKATELYKFSEHDIIVGDVIVCETSMII